MAQQTAPSAGRSGSNARKRVYGLMLAAFLNGVAVGLLVTPSITYRGLAIWGVLLCGLFILAASVSRWRDPV